MLYSLLIDADRMDSQRFDQRVLGEPLPLFSPALDARQALGEDVVQEHHSGDCAQARAEDEDTATLDAAARQHRLQTENWDVSVIVTPSVLFFDSLFSSRPADLRRIHNFVHSVVILDEVQTLPPGLLSLLLSMMKGLAENWGTTFLFCTATQPAFEKHAGPTRTTRAGSPAKSSP